MGNGALQPLLYPESMVVIGAGRSGLGRLVLDHVVAAGFGGELWAVHPSRDQVGGVQAFETVADLPAAPDLAVIALRRDSAVTAARQLAARGCGAAVVVSAGFSEVGEAGIEAERTLLEAASSSGMRVLGPNCMGLVNTHPKARLHASFGVGPAPSGKLAVIAQSGSVADYVLYHAGAWGLGISLLASVGNEADVTMGELVEAATSDRRTRVIACYVEEPAAPEALLRALRKAARRKPVVVLKAGRTAAGAGAAASHTGRLATPDKGVAEALIAATGACLVDTLEELMGASVALARHPAGAGRRVAVVTNAGGPAVLAADEIVNRGLRVATPNTAARRKLLRASPNAAVKGPIVDLTASGTTEHFGAAARALRPSAEALLCLVMSPEGTDSTPVVEAVAESWEGPLTFSILARSEGVERARASAAALGIPAATEPALAVRCLSALAHRAQRGRQAAARPRPLAKGVERLVRSILEGALCEGRHGLSLVEGLKLATACGIPTAPFSMARGVDEAVEAGRLLGFPVYAKVDVGGTIHRTELGGVRGPLGNDDELRDAARALLRSRAHWLGGRESRLVIQRAIHGEELLLGVVRVSRWGPAALVGRGGVFAEAESDIAFFPLGGGAPAAKDALSRLRAAPRFGRVRGRQAVSIDSVAETAAKLGRLASTFPIIYEIELSPFVAGRGRAPHGAVDVRVVLDPDAETAVEARR